MGSFVRRTHSREKGERMEKRTVLFTRLSIRMIALSNCMERRTRNQSHCRLLRVVQSECRCQISGPNAFLLLTHAHKSSVKQWGQSSSLWNTRSRKREAAEKAVVTDDDVRHEWERKAKRRPESNTSDTHFLRGTRRRGDGECSNDLTTSGCLSCQSFW